MRAPRHSIDDPNEFRRKTPPSVWCARWTWGYARVILRDDERGWNPVSHTAPTVPPKDSPAAEVGRSRGPDLGEEFVHLPAQTLGLMVECLGGRFNTMGRLACYLRPLAYSGNMVGDFLGT